MDKKTALITLLENSFWVSDKAKLRILKNLDAYTDIQIDQLGKFLAEERDVMVKDKVKILENTTSLLEIIEDVAVNIE